MMTMSAARKYPPELRERAVRLVQEAVKEDPELSLNAAAVRIATRVVGAVTRPMTLDELVEDAIRDAGNDPFGARTSV